MKTRYQELNRAKGWNRRSVNVQFTNPDHLMDSLIFVRETGREAAFWEGIGRVVSMFVSDAAGQDEFLGGPDGVEPAVPGDVVEIQFWPDSPSRPSFAWVAFKVPDIPGAPRVRLLHGGLILHGEDKTWTTHT